MGLDQYEVRRCDGRFRHITLAMLVRRIWRSSGNRRWNREKRGHYGPKEELIPLMVPEVRRLLTRLVWTETQQPDFIPCWSWWRRRHQARARQCHYKRRLSRLRLYY